MERAGVETHEMVLATANPTKDPIKLVTAASGMARRRINTLAPTSVAMALEAKQEEGFHFAGTM